jgi:acid stress-induced BolA-like protein IbaG/YrbA
MYHGTNAYGSIDNVDYTTSADTTYTFAGTEADGIYYLFVDNTGVITPNTSSARQTDKALFAQCTIVSGAIDSFQAYGVLELFKKQDAVQLQKTIYDNTVKYIDTTSSKSITSGYIAEYNGFVRWNCQTTEGANYSLYIDDVQIYNFGSFSTAVIALTFPVKKGQKITFQGTAVFFGQL